MRTKEAAERVVITGFMGTGKTRVGRLLAARLGLPFLDLDRAVEAAAGRSVAAIFAAEGEEGFRRAEREAAAWASRLRRVVIATGGGTFLDAASRRALAERAVTVALTSDPGTIVGRIERSVKDGERPVLSTDSLRERVEGLLAAREDLYRGADVTLNTAGLSPEEVADRLHQAVVAAGIAPAEETPVQILKAQGGDVVVGARPSHLPGLLSGLGVPRFFTVADRRTAALFGDWSPVDATVPVGEDAKRLSHLEVLLETMVSVGVGRDGAVVAVGGGVVGDLAGFAAAVYMRGIPIVQAPTTLLAQIDSSVGGKTAVNLAGVKNLAGAFHPPALVFAAVEPLLCLPDEDFRQGLAEAVKYGLACDPAMLDLLEKDGPAILERRPASLVGLVTAGIRAKAVVVEADPTERGDRRRLNLGHSVGHALETASGLAHGDAVAFGMAVVTRMAVKAGLCGPPVWDRLRRVYAALDLSLEPGARAFAEQPPQEFLRRLAGDKKNVDGRPRLVLPLAPGVVDLDHRADPRDVIEACAETVESA